MRPIKFKECNVNVAEHQDEYITFPMYRHPSSPHGEMVGCWRLSFRERIRVLFTGLIWQAVLAFGNPLQPQRLSTKKEDVI